MTPAKIREEERRQRRGDILAVAIAVALGAALAWILLSIQGLQRDLAVANDARAALADQVKRMKGAPAAGGAEVRTEEDGSDVPERLKWPSPSDPPEASDAPTADPPKHPGKSRTPAASPSLRSSVLRNPWRSPCLEEDDLHPLLGDPDALACQKWAKPSPTPKAVPRSTPAPGGAAEPSSRSGAPFAEEGDRTLLRQLPGPTPEPSPGTPSPSRSEPRTLPTPSPRTDASPDLACRRGS